MLQYGESVDVADWFSSFCAVHDSSDGTPEDEQQAASISKPKKRRGRPSKKVLQKVRALVLLVQGWRDCKGAQKVNTSLLLCKLLQSCSKSCNARQLCMTAVSAAKQSAATQGREQNVNIW